MKIKSFNHMGIVSSDLDRTRQFYIRFLGMEEIARPSNFGFGGLWLRYGEDDELHVLLASDTTSDPGLPDPGPSKVSGLATHIAFEVDDLTEFIDHAAELGIPQVGGPYIRGKGARQVYLEDPDGYIIELFERVSHALDPIAEVRAPISNASNRLTGQSQ